MGTRSVKMLWDLQHTPPQLTLCSAVANIPKGWLRGRTSANAKESAYLTRLELLCNGKVILREPDLRSSAEIVCLVWPSVGYIFVKTSNVNWKKMG